MMRLLFALMAGMLCGVLGMRQGKRIREENAALTRWQVLLQHLCLLLQEGLSLPEVFVQCATEDTPCDALLLRIAHELEQQPMASLPQLYTPQGAEGAVLARLMAGLSHGSLESRVLCARQAAEEMSLLAQNSQGRVQQDARMWQTLGWTCGGCLTLLML